MKYAVTVVSPPGYPHSAAFREVAETLHYALRALGHDSVITTEGVVPGHRHIVLGSNLLVQHPMPLAADAILYNLEQVQPGSPWFRPELVDLFARHTLWDYSAQNAAALRTLGVEVARVVPIGYVPEMTRIERAAAPDIDVLFVGSINDRRKRVLEQMVVEQRLRVKAAFGKYGQERDALIARATLILNVHYYDAKVLEMVRLSYLLANHSAVLSEHSADPDEDRALAGGVAFADYASLAERARALIDAPEERDRMARQGFEIMRARPAAEYVRVALAASVPTA